MATTPKTPRRPKINLLREVADVEKIAEGVCDLLADYPDSPALIKILWQLEWLRQGLLDRMYDYEAVKKTATAACQKAEDRLMSTHARNPDPAHESPAERS